MAAHAVLSGDTITITGLYVDGEERPLQGTVSGRADRGEELARGLAHTLKEDAACQEK